MRFDVEEMTAAFRDANDFDSVTEHDLRRPRPWYTYGDERYFNVLNNSGTANFQWDMSLLYDRYYDRAETLAAVTDFEVVEELNEHAMMDATSLNNGNTGNTDNTDNTGNTGNTDNTNATDNTDN